MKTYMYIYYITAGIDLDAVVLFLVVFRGGLWRSAQCHGCLHGAISAASLGVCPRRLSGAISTTARLVSMGWGWLTCFINGFIIFYGYKQDIIDYIYIYFYTHVYTCMHTNIQTYKQTVMHTYMYIWLCIYDDIYMYIRVFFLWGYDRQDERQTQGWLVDPMCPPLLLQMIRYLLLISSMMGHSQLLYQWNAGCLLLVIHSRSSQTVLLCTVTSAGEPPHC